MFERFFVYCQDRGGLLEKITDNNFCRWLANRNHKNYFIELSYNYNDDNYTIVITPKVSEFIKVFYGSDSAIGAGFLDNSEDLANFIQDSIKNKDEIISFKEYLEKEKYNRGL